MGRPMARSVLSLPVAVAWTSVFVLLAGPASGASIAFVGPTVDQWYPAAGLPIYGNASDPPLDSRLFGSAGGFANGTFEGTTLNPAGNLALEGDNQTTFRFFDDFSSYAANTSAANASPYYHTAFWDPAVNDPWLVENNTSAMLSGAPSMGAIARPPGQQNYLYWHVTVPTAITALHVSFRYASENASFRFYGMVYTGNQASAFNTTSELVNTNFLTVPETLYVGNLSSHFQNQTTAYLAFRYTRGSSGGWAAFDDLTVDVSYLPSATPVNITKYDRFQRTNRAPEFDAKWWQPQGLWTFEGGTLEHHRGPGGVDAQSSIYEPHAVPSGLLSVRLEFDLACSAFTPTYWIEASYGPTSKGPWTSIANHSDPANTSHIDLQVVTTPGQATFVVRFESFNVCWAGSYNITLMMGGNSSGIERGVYTSETLDVGYHVDWDHVEFALESPGGAGARFEVRTGANASAWSAWAFATNGSGVPNVTGRLFQFRATLWAPSAPESVNVTAVQIFFRGFSRVEGSADGWNTSFALNMVLVGSASHVNWSGAVPFVSGQTLVSVRVFDSSGTFVEAQRYLWGDSFAPDQPVAPTSLGPFSNARPQAWSWIPPADVGMGIAGYQLRLGTAPNGSDIMSNYSVGNSTTYQLASPLESVSYYLAVRAIDRAGNWGPWSNDSVPVLVDFTAPVAGKPAGPSRWVNATSLTWTWAAAVDQGSGVAAYEVRLGTTPGGQQVLNQIVNASTSFTFENATNGSTYYLAIRAQDRAGNWGPLGAPSDPVSVDLVAPAVVQLAPSPSGYQNRSSATWAWSSVTDSGSPPFSYEVRAGSTPGGADITPVTSAGATPSFEIVALPDSQGVYFEVRCVDAAGNAGPWASAPVLLVDRTSPTAPLLTGDGPPWAPDFPVEWNWGAAVDSYSGVTAYLVKVGTSPGGQEVWPESSTAVTAFSLGDQGRGGVFFLTIRAVDAAGNVGPAALSIGRGVDLLPPVAPSSVVAPESPNASSELRWSWSGASDADSGLAGYEVRVGSGPGLDDVRSWEFVSLPNFTFEGAQTGKSYFLGVRAVDHVGLRSLQIASASSVIVDTMGPDAPLNLRPSSAFSRNATLSLSWDPPLDRGASGVVSYELEKDDGSTTQIEVAGPSPPSTLTGADGKAYSLRIRGIDGAGNRGDWSGPVNVVFDLSSPTAPANLRVSSAGGSITVEWDPSHDTVTSVAGYRVLIGTASGAGDVVNTTLGIETRFSRTVTPGTTYFVTVSAIDQAGNEAAAPPQPISVGAAASAPGAWLVVAALAAVAVVGLRRRRAP